MNKALQSSPSRLKKSQPSSTSSLHKSKIHLPSRYAQPSKPEKSGFHDILNSIESQIRQEVVQRQQSPEPKFKLVADLPSTEMKRENSSQFKSKPLKREDNDMVQFKEIFLNPREQTLKAIKKLKESPKTIVKQYEKLLKFEKGLDMATEESEKLENNNIKESYQQAIELLQSEDEPNGTMTRIQEDFYQTQITVEPPNLNSTASLISIPKPIIAPSLPQNYKGEKDLNVRELLLRAKAGMNSDDIEKEAHLSFYLGEVYTEKRYFRQALKFFRRFLGFAKMMEDRIGMSVGANRVGISYYNCKQYEKSISFHNENLKLSDHDNCFYGFYNIGICYRKLNRLQQALEYFESALNWAQDKGEEESECIALGQIAVTYQSMEQFQHAVDRFEDSLKISERIKKKNLKLSNLWNILKISSMLKIKPMEQLQRIAEEAFSCAKELGQTSSLDILRCNIGILRGSEQYYAEVGPELGKEKQEIEELDE